MTKQTEALKLALEALDDMHIVDFPLEDLRNWNKAFTAIKQALAEQEQDNRRLKIALRQWEDSKTYALELQKRLVQYEGGSPMILNTQLEPEPVADELALIRSVLQGYPPSMARADALRAVKVVEAAHIGATK